MKAENERRLQEEASYAYTGRGGTAMPDNRQTEQDDRPNAADSAPARHVGSRVKLLLTGLGVWAGLRGQQTASAADVQRELNTPSMKRIVDVSPNITIPSEPGDLSKQAVQQYVDQKQGGVGIQTSGIDIPVTPPSVDLSGAQPAKESLPKDVSLIDRQAPASVKPVETPTPLDSTSNPEDIKQTELFTVPLSTVIDTATLAQLQKDWNPATNTYNAEGVFTILKSLGYDTQAKIDQLNLGSEAFSAALQAQVTGTDGKKYGIADVVAPAVTRYPNADGSISFSLGHIAVRDLQFPDGRVVTQGSLIYSENNNNGAPFAALSIPKSSSATVKYGEAVVPVSTTQGVPVGTLEIGGYPAVAWVALDQDGTAGRVNVQKTIGTQPVELDGIDGSKTNLDPNTKVSVLTTDQDSALVMTQEHGQDVPGTIGLLYTNQLANETPATPAPQSTPNGLKQASFVRIEVNGQPGTGNEISPDITASAPAGSKVEKLNNQIVATVDHDLPDSPRYLYKDGSWVDQHPGRTQTDAILPKGVFDQLQIAGWDPAFKAYKLTNGHFFFPGTGKVADDHGSYDKSDIENGEYIMGEIYKTKDYVAGKSGMRLLSFFAKNGYVQDLVIDPSLPADTKANISDAVAKAVVDTYPELTGKTMVAYYGDYNPSLGREPLTSISFGQARSNGYFGDLKSSDVIYINMGLAEVTSNPPKNKETGVLLNLLQAIDFTMKWKKAGGTKDAEFALAQSEKPGGGYVFSIDTEVFKSPEMPKPNATMVNGKPAYYPFVLTTK